MGVLTQGIRRGEGAWWGGGGTNSRYQKGEGRGGGGGVLTQGIRRGQGVVGGWGY